MMNKSCEVKSFYRFIEFTSKLLHNNLPHERSKLLILDQFKAESVEELECKQFADSYHYLLNNIKQSLQASVIQSSYYLLTHQPLEDNKVAAILKKYYENFDESAHYLACLIHLCVIKQIEQKNIPFAFMLSNYVMLKKNRKPLIPYSYMFQTYLKAIHEQNIEKLMLLFCEIEIVHKRKWNHVILTQKEIIEKIKQNQIALKRKFNVKKLYLYGSYAKQKMNPSSDIDFLVIYERDLLNLEKSRMEKKLTEFLEQLMNQKIDLIDFTHALTNLEIGEMEQIITLL